jgi:anti-sigma factor RsiW
MRPIEPVELSAFIDGELDAGRAAEVRAALALDAALRERYEALVHADAHLRSLSAGAELTPRIRWPSLEASSGPTGSGLWRLVPVLVIPAAWLIGKLTYTESVALTASTAAFLVLTVSVLRLVLNEEEGAAPALADNSRDNTHEDL